MRGIALATWVRMRDTCSVALLTGLVTGCATLSSNAPALTPQQDCERNNGAWRQVLNFCEHGR